MGEITVKAGKFKRLLDYLDKVGLDARQIARRLNMVPERILALDSHEVLPAQQYARLYKEAAREMQALGHQIPWAAGLGSDAFELMCRSIITSRTLGEALSVAERFEKLIYPMVGYNMRLLDEGGDSVRLSYHVRVSDEPSALAPANWDRWDSKPVVARTSGLLVWTAFCGWLTGRAIEVLEVNVAAPFLSKAYDERLRGVFHCAVNYDSDINTVRFGRDTLERRLVQTQDSLMEFLDTSVYHLIAVDSEPASTSAAIKSLVTIELPSGLPSFADVASSLHMSESSLRRRLQKENTSYQALKDEIRCEVAIDHLLNQNAKVADLAEYLGFTEPSSFVRSFKSWTGETPTRYREKIQLLGEA
jgi:AraC-like DNA-binding protein